MESTGIVKKETIRNSTYQEKNLESLVLKRLYQKVPCTFL